MAARAPVLESTVPAECPLPTGGPGLAQKPPVPGRHPTVSDPVREPGSNSRKRKGRRAGGRRVPVGRTGGLGQRGSQDTRERTEAGPREGRDASGPRVWSKLRSHVSPHPPQPTTQFYTRSHSPTAPRTMTIAHITGTGLTPAKFCTLGSPDADRLVHWCGNVTCTHNDKPSQRHTRTPTFAHNSNPTLARSPEHVHPCSQAHLPTQAGALCP